MPKGEYLSDDQLGYAGVGEPGRSVKPLRMLSQFESDYLNCGTSSMVERLVVVQGMRVQFPRVTPFPLRLIGKTPGFGPGYRGSNPLGGAISKGETCSYQKQN